jgi:hypothetical protein
VHAVLRSYITSGIAIVGISVIAVTPIAATPHDIKIENPAVQLTATPFAEYEELFNKSLDNIQGLIALALKPPPPPSEIPFTLESLIAGLFDVSANVAAFQNEISGLPGQVQALQQITQMYLQAASHELQAGNTEVALQIVLYAALSDAGSIVSVATYPLTLLGPDFEEVAPVFAEAILNAAVAPAVSAVAASGEVAQNVLDELKAGDPQDVLGDLIAAPAVVTDGFLNGTKLETGVFGTVDIPGILTATTLQDAEGPGPISLAIQFVQIARTLLTPTAATALSPTATQDTVKSFNLDVNQDVPPAVPPSIEKSTTSEDLKIQPKGNILDTDEVTNSGVDSSKANAHRPRLLGNDTGTEAGSSPTAKSMGKGIQGIRDTVRNVVKGLTGSGRQDEGADSSNNAKGAG